MGRSVNWATCKLPPVTAERIEFYLDIVAEQMEKVGKEAELYLPIWHRLERELEKQREKEAALAAARARLTRSRDRTAA